jgi:hypothetical protein
LSRKHAALAAIAVILGIAVNAILNLATSDGGWWVLATIVAAAVFAWYEFARTLAAAPATTSDRQPTARAGRHRARTRGTVAVAAVAVLLTIAARSAPTQR